MDNTRKIGGAMLKDDPQRYKIKIREGSIKREHLDPEFVNLWDDVKNNAIAVNTLQKLLNQYYSTMQNAISFVGDKSVADAGSVTVGFTVKLAKVNVGDSIHVIVYANGTKVHDSYPPYYHFQSEGEYDFNVNVTLSTNVIFKAEITVNDFTYIGLWELSTEAKYKLSSNEMYDNTLNNTQNNINNDFESRLVALEMGGMHSSVTLTGGNVNEYTGSNITFNMSGTVKFNNSAIPQGATVAWTVTGNGISGGSASGNTAQISVTAQTSAVGNYTYNVVAVVTYNGHQFSSSNSTTFNIVKRSYIGFSDSDTASSSILLNPQKNALVTSLVNKNYTLTNSGMKYLWIITPSNINSVSTDAQGIYPVEIVKKSTIDGLNYYKSEDLIDSGTLTFYIH